MKSLKMEVSEVTPLHRRMSGVSVIRDHSVRCIPENPTLIFSYI